MFLDDEDRRREICVEYAHNLQITEIRICDDNSDRQIIKEDLTKNDFEK
jgi:hypothetical protein